MRVFRCDNYKLSAKIADKVGPNGYAVFPATITRAGIFSYRQADGSLVRELRHPDEVFKPQSMNSLKNVPLITEKDHLDCLTKGLPVNKVDEFTQLGVVGSDIRRNRADELEGDITVYRPNTLQKIDSGEERELSAGYTVDIISEPGEYRGQKYDQKQTNIIYGHVAAVGRGRAGTAKFRIDSKTAILSTEEMNFQEEDSVGDETRIIKEIPGLNVGKGEHGFRLDSLKIEETPEVLGLLTQRNTLITECEKAQARADRAEGETETLKADKEKLEKELKNSIPADRLDAEIEERALLNDMCETMEIESKGKSSKDLKKAICMKDKPGAYDEKRLDGDFLEGVFAPIQADWQKIKGEHKTLKGVENSLNQGKNAEGKTPIQYAIPASA